VISWYGGVSPRLATGVPPLRESTERTEVVTMSHQLVRKAGCRKFKPCLGLLEERVTPTVNSLSVAALTPGLGGASTVSIGGVIDESSSSAAATLSVKYTVTNGQGNVLASGPLTVNSPYLNSLSYSYLATIPRSVTPGNIETITVSATDTDSMDVPLQTTANLYVSTVKAVSTLGFGSTASNGDKFGGSGQGKITVTQSTAKGLFAKGKASFQLGSNSYNHALINGAASGPFQFSVNTLGAMSLKITRGNTNFKLGSYAGGPVAGGGLGGVVSGNFTYTWFTNSSLTFQSQGSAYLSAQLGGSTTTTTTANTVSVLSNKLAISFLSDASGDLRFSVVGNSTISGGFSKSALFDIFG
jgi:hypothetical protein